MDKIKILVFTKHSNINIIRDTMKDMMKDAIQSHSCGTSYFEIENDISTIECRPYSMMHRGCKGHIIVLDGEFSKDELEDIIIPMGIPYKGRKPIYMPLEDLVKSYDNYYNTLNSMKG